MFAPLGFVILFEGDVDGIAEEPAAGLGLFGDGDGSLVGLFEGKGVSDGKPAAELGLFDDGRLKKGLFESCGVSDGSSLGFTGGSLRDGVVDGSGECIIDGCSVGVSDGIDGLAECIKDGCVVTCVIELSDGDTDGVSGQCSPTK